MHRLAAAARPADSVAVRRRRRCWSGGLRPWFLQTVIVIQMGTGEKAAFPGLDKAPEIFSAKTTASEIRAKMKP